MAQYWAPTNTGRRERRYIYAGSRQEALRKLREAQADAGFVYDSGRTSVRYAHAVLRRALGWAVVRGLVTRNVAGGASLPRLMKKEMRILTPEETKRLLKAARGERLEALFLVALTCGLRQGEMLALRWEDVDLDAPKITVRRQIQRSRDGSGLIVVPTKNKKSRAIRPGAVAVGALRAHRERQDEEIAAARGLWKDPGLVFATTLGTPLDASNLVARDFKPLLLRAGLPNICWHDLRHGCGSLLLSEGVPVKVVQEILGHSSMAVTMDIYAHVLPDMQERAAAAMDGLFLDT